ncbi:MAG: replication initiator protein A, partial [Oscillibacter sp.]|nr:replication initiator protein A [Oscillibacter sp.]
LDRMGHSVRNRKMDEQGRVFIFFKLETALDTLGIGRNKGVRLFKELELIGLIERKKQGQGKPAIIYVKNFIPPDSPLPDPPDEPDDTHDPEDEDSFPAGSSEDTEPGWNGTLWNQSAMPEGADGAGPGVVLRLTVLEPGDSMEPDESTLDGDSVSVEAGPDEIHAEAGTDGGCMDGGGADAGTDGGTDGDGAEQTVSAPPGQTSQIGKSGLPTPEKAPEVLTSQNGTSGSSASDFPKQEVCTSRKGKSGSIKTGSPDCTKRDPNDTKKNNTEKNETSLSNINLSPPTPSPPAAVSAAFPTFAEIRAYRMTREERRQEMEDCRECVREQIGYELLIRNHPEDQRRIDGYVEVLAEALCCEDEYQRIGQQDYSSYQVRERLYQLTGEHITYVMDCMKNTPSRILNPRAYALTALFNAPLTIDQYYDSMIARDMAQESGGYFSDRDACGFKYSSYPRNQYGGGSGSRRYYGGRDDYGCGQRAV